MTNIQQYMTVIMLSKLKKKKKKCKTIQFYQTLQSYKWKKKYDINNLTQKYLLYKKFVSWSCNGTSVALLTDYINNPIYQDLIDEDDYFENASNERVYMDLRASSEYTNEAEKLDRNYSKISLSILLKFAATKKDKIKGLGLF